MGDMREIMQAQAEFSKKQYNERRAKNPQRIEYAKQQLKANNIEFSVKNYDTGHIHARRKCDDELFQFWAGTGKILNHTKLRGIHAFINLLNKKETK